MFDKIKTALLLVALQGMECVSLKFPDLQTQEYFFPMINAIGVNESILYYKETNNDVLIYSILKEAFKNQPVLLLSGENITLEGVYNINPNVILLTETLNIEDFETHAFQTLLKSNWAILYLVITTKSENYTCENGTLSENVFAETKTYLNELWQVFRIVRVVVSFPYTCSMHYVIYDGKEWSSTDIYNRGIRLIRPKNQFEHAIAIANSGDSRELIKDYPLRVNIFYRFPTSITECDVFSLYTNMDFQSYQAFCGLDGMVMYDYINHYKFNLTENLNDSICDFYGSVDNNTTTGSLGCILRQQIDISFNSRFVRQYTTDQYFFLYYVAQDSLCVVMKSADKIPLWHFTFNMLSAYIWMYLLPSLCLVGVVAWLMAKLSAKFTGERSLKLHSYVFNAIYSSLIGLLLRKDGRGLIMKGTPLLCSIILLSIFQGHVNYQFTTRSHYCEIKTLDELVESPYVVYTSPTVMDILKPSWDLDPKKHQGFLKHIRSIENSTTIDFLLENRYAATIARKQDIRVEVLQKYTDKYGRPQIYIVDECFQNFYLSHIARRGFLFVEESLKFVMRLTEAGLPNKYYKWTQRTFNLADSWPKIGPHPRPFKKTPLKKLRTVFWLLLLGYLISGLVFIIEKWRGSTL